MEHLSLGHLIGSNCYWHSKSHVSKSLQRWNILVFLGQREACVPSSTTITTSSDTRIGHCVVGHLSSYVGNGTPLLETLGIDVRILGR